jgi:hypothetical protein
MEVQRIGPAASAIPSQKDLDPNRTKRIFAVSKAFEKGGLAVEQIEGIAPQARKDYSRGPSPELAGLSGITYIATQNVRVRGIRRHDGEVAEVLYYKIEDSRNRVVLIYLTPEGLITDQDVVEITT